MQRLLDILRVSREAMFLTEPGGAILAANAAACRLLGYTAEQLVTMTWGDLADPDDARARDAVETPAPVAPFLGELTVRRSGGVKLKAWGSTLLVQAEDRPLLWTTLRDLSAVDVLRESEEKFRALSEATFEAVFVHKDGKILLTNDATDRLYRVPPGGMVGRSMYEFIGVESSEVVRAHADTLSPEVYEAFALRADGTTFPAEVRGRTITYRGEAVRMVAVHDLTERKRLESRLALADRLASIGTLAAGVAHEINNPLAYVLLNIELVRAAIAGDASAWERARPNALAAIDSALEGGLRVKRIVADLRDFARGSGEEARAVDLERAIGFACAIAKNSIRHRAQLHLDIAGMPHVRANETRVGQVFLNLLVNAAEALPEGDVARQRIEVVARHVGAWVEVTVSDTGAGIPKELLPHIFEPFVTTKTQGGGTGLGLSIAHGIVTSLGGTIDVQSSDRGTTFRVRLPVAGEEPSPVLRVARVQSRDHRPRVLVVDDEPRVRGVVARALEAHFDVVTAGSGAEALALLESGRSFDVMLVDLMMPDMAGIDLHEAVSRQWPELGRHTALMTGGPFSPRAQQFYESSGLPALEKPFTIVQLEELILDTLETGQSTEQARSPTT